MLNIGVLLGGRQQLKSRMLMLLSVRMPTLDIGAIVRLVVTIMLSLWKHRRMLVDTCRCCRGTNEGSWFRLRLSIRCSGLGCIRDWQRLVRVLRGIWPCVLSLCRTWLLSALVDPSVRYTASSS